METWVTNETIYEGPIVRLRTGQARLDDGRLVHREVVDHGGGVGIVPILDDAVILVKQFRIATGEHIVEIPAGRLELGEDPAHRARCELEEEVGYRAGRMVHVGSCYCSPGFTNQIDHIYLAFDLVQTQQRLEHDESIELVTVPLVDLAARLAAREFNDMKTVIGLREALLALSR